MDLNDDDIENAGTTSTVDLSLTDPTLLYAAGPDGDLYGAYDPADHSDVFDAANAALANASQTEQVSLYWPYTGDTSVGATTTLDLVGRRIPNLYGHGRYGTRINYTATDGTPAIDVDAQGNGIDPEWNGFALIGPGKSASGNGNGIEYVDGFNHGQSLRRLTIRQFPGKGVYGTGNFLTGEMAMCHIVENGLEGLDIERFNVGTIRNSLIQRNGNATGNPQVRLRDSLGGTLAFNDIDSRGGDTGLTQTDGVLIEGINKRGGVFVAFNYMEDCSTGIIYRNSGLPVGRAGAHFNRIQGSATGIHVESGNNNPNIAWNWFQSNSSEDILLDNEAVLGPNSHFAETNRVTDNTGGAYTSVSQSTGSYPW